MQIRVIGNNTTVSLDDLFSNLRPVALEDILYSVGLVSLRLSKEYIPHLKNFPLANLHTLPTLAKAALLSSSIRDDGKLNPLSEDQMLTFLGQVMSLSDYKQRVIVTPGSAGTINITDDHILDYFGRISLTQGEIQEEIFNILARNYWLFVKLKSEWRGLDLETTVKDLLGLSVADFLLVTIVFCWSIQGDESLPIINTKNLSTLKSEYVDRAPNIFKAVDLHLARSLVEHVSLTKKSFESATKKTGGTHHFSTLPWSLEDFPFIKIDDVNYLVPFAHYLANTLQRLLFKHLNLEQMKREGRSKYDSKLAFARGYAFEEYVRVLLRERYGDKVIREPEYYGTSDPGPDAVVVEDRLIFSMSIILAGQNLRISCKPDDLAGLIDKLHNEFDRVVKWIGSYGNNDFKGIPPLLWRVVIITLVPIPNIQFDCFRTIIKEKFNSTWRKTFGNIPICKWSIIPVIGLENLIAVCNEYNKTPEEIFAQYDGYMERSKDFDAQKQQIKFSFYNFLHQEYSLKIKKHRSLVLKQGFLEMRESLCREYFGEDPPPFQIE